MLIIHLPVTFPCSAGTSHTFWKQGQDELVFSANRNSEKIRIPVCAGLSRRAQTYSVLTSFDGTNGSELTATPLIDGVGNVFGTTQGYGDCGVIYELVNNGGGSYTHNTLYNFTCGDDGGDPYGGVVMDSEGNLYGTALGYGSASSGVVYELVNHGGDSYKFEVIYAFSEEGGRGPLGDLAMFKGSFYGVTNESGGGCKRGNCGTVYRLS